MKKQKDLPRYTNIKKEMISKTHNLQEKKRRIFDYIQSELGEVLTSDEIASIIAKKRILMTKQFKETEKSTIDQYKEMIEKNKLYHQTQKDETIKQKKLAEIAESVKINTTGYKIFDTLQYYLRIMRHSSMEKQMQKISKDITQEEFVRKLYEDYNPKMLKRVFTLFHDYPEAKNDYVQEWRSVGEVWGSYHKVPSFYVLNFLSQLPKSLVEGYRSKKLDTKTVIFYDVITSIYEQVKKEGKKVLSDGGRREHIKGSTFGRECMIAYLRNDTQIINMFINIVSTALAVRHHDGTNSREFRESANNILNKNISYYLYDVPQDIIDQYST